MTFTSAAVVFVQASLTNSLDVLPLPVTGDPADAVNVLVVIVEILYVATVGVFASVFNVIAEAISLQTVAVWLSTTGSGLTVTVTVNGSPKHPVVDATGTIV